MPFIYTDELIFQADPYICGHNGHADTSCAYTFSYYVNALVNGTFEDTIGPGMETILGPM